MTRLRESMSGKWPQLGGFCPCSSDMRTSLWSMRMGCVDAGSRYGSATADKSQNAKWQPSTVLINNLDQDQWTQGGTFIMKYCIATT